MLGECDHWVNHGNLQALSFLYKRNMISQDPAKGTKVVGKAEKEKKGTDLEKEVEIVLIYHPVDRMEPNGLSDPRVVAIWDLSLTNKKLSVIMVKKTGHYGRDFQLKRPNRMPIL